MACIRLAVVGSRHYDDYARFVSVVDDWIAVNGAPDELISGGASGVDTMAERFAKERNVPMRVFRADWATYGKRAGPMRNALIVDACTHVLALPDRDGKGTQITMRLARERGRPLTAVNVMPRETYVNEFFNEDCIRGARKRLPDGSIDLVLCDPPYGIDGATLDKHYNRDESHVLGGYVDVASADYASFSEAWIAEAARVLRPGGGLFVFSGYSQLPAVISALDNPVNGLRRVRHLIWKYNFGVWTTKKYVSSHYHILYYRARSANDDVSPSWHGDDLVLAERGSVWFVNREYKTGQTRNRNQLPSMLLERLVRLGSTPSDIVADFFLGSFSTARTAIAMGRNATGFEVNKEAFDYWLRETRAMLAERPTQHPNVVCTGNSHCGHRPTSEMTPVTPTKGGAVDLVVSWPKTLPTSEWFDSVLTYVRPGACIYFVTTVNDVGDAINRLRGAGFEEINHIIWLCADGSANDEETHHHILFYQRPGGKRTFNTYAVYPQRQRLPSGGSANYADREDVWTSVERGALPWKDVVRKTIQYSSNVHDRVAEFCAGDGAVSAVARELNRVYVVTSGR